MIRCGKTATVWDFIKTNLVGEKGLPKDDLYMPAYDVVWTRDGEVWGIEQKYIDTRR